MKWLAAILAGVAFLLIAGSARSLPAPGTPGEGQGGGSPSGVPTENPLPNPLAGSRPIRSLPPEYRGREKSDVGAAPRFVFVDAYIDTKNQSLAAYQFELTAQGAGVTLVGVEGGDHPAYAEPPYYDPKANLQNRIVIAAFNTGDDLPHGRTRVARVMVRITGPDPVWTAKLSVAAAPDAKPIDATIQVSEGAAP
jgi:hypothetical protein